MVMLPCKVANPSNARSCLPKPEQFFGLNRLMAFAHSSAKGSAARRNLYDTGPILALMVSTNLLSDAIKDLFGLKTLLYSALRAARQRYSAKPAAKML